MSYRVIKRIRGIAYLYEQTSFRVGRKVYTKCKCLGRYDGSGLSVFGPSEEAGKETISILENSDSALSEIQKNATQILQQSVHQKRDQSNTTSLSIHIPLVNHKISESALVKEVDLAHRMLDHLEIPRECLPSIHVKYGYFPCHKRKRRNGEYRVTLPWKSRGSRTAFKRSYSQAVARATLDAVGKQNPEAYAELARTFDDTFRSSQSAIGVYFRYASPMGVYKAMALRWFGVVRKSKECLPNPGSVGMVDFSKRKTWRDDLVSLMATLQKSGMKRTEKKFREQLTKARREVTASMTNMKRFSRFSPRRVRARKRLKKALAREQAQLAMQRKLQHVSNFFGMS